MVVSMGDAGPTAVISRRYKNQVPPLMLWFTLLPADAENFAIKRLK